MITYVVVVNILVRRVRRQVKNIEDVNFNGQKVLQYTSNELRDFAIVALIKNYSLHFLAYYQVEL